jgi:hypothetical protein
MSADVLLRVSRVLKAVIEGDLDVGPGKVTIGAPPVASANLEGPRLGLFLYRIDPVPELRNLPRALPPERPGMAAPTERALPLNLRFLLTAFGPEDERAAGAEQLLLLGAALRAIQLAAVLGADRLPGQTARVTLDPVGTEEISRVWSLFPNTAFQTSVGLLVTPVYVGLGAQPLAAPVTSVIQGDPDRLEVRQ